MSAKSAKIKANEAADFYLWFCREHGDLLTNLRLQKLLYYAQAWYLGFFDRPLFAAKFQAWVHGPVIPSVYRRFKDSGWQPITAEIDEPVLPHGVVEHLTSVFEVYGRYTAWELERMTHAEKPWREARDGLKPDENSEEEIDEDTMREFCLDMMKKSKRK